MLQLQAQRLLVVVTVNETLALVQTQTVDNAGVSLGIVNDNVAGREQAVDDRKHALISEVEQESVLLAYECGKLALQLLVILGLTAHHAGTHRGRHSELCSAFGIGLAYFGVVCQSKIVVKAPVQHHLAAEAHVRAYFSLEFGECEVAVDTLHVLADRTSGISFQTIKNIYHKYCYLM